MKKLKILLVDDEPMFIEIIKTRLEANDCHVESASNGKEALEKTESNSFDGVLLDILMPVLDGMATLEILRKKDKDLPVFMLTAFSTQDRMEQARKVGATGFLVKDAELKTEIINVLKQLRGE
ncbi:MAG: response regulator [Candidatus Omnitrophica bacterium]|nr:response regulator [Candidatus Omnitrophota bacterium]